MNEEDQPVGIFYFLATVLGLGAAVTFGLRFQAGITAPWAGGIIVCAFLALVMGFIGWSNQAAARERERVRNLR